MVSEPAVFLVQITVALIYVRGDEFGFDSKTYNLLPRGSVVPTVLMLPTAIPVPQLHSMPPAWMKPLLQPPGLPEVCFACFLDQITFIFERILTSHPSLPSWSKKSPSWSMSLCNNIGEPTKIE